MEIDCPRCEHPNWVGLRFCTRCGLRQRGFAARPPGAAAPQVAWRGEVAEWPLGGAVDLFPAFGDLVFAGPQGAWVLTPGEDARPRPLGLPPGDGPLEALAVDRWLVLRQGGRLRVLAAPLMHTPHLASLGQDEGTALPLPRGTAERLAAFSPSLGRARVGSIARLGRHLAALVAEGAETQLQVFDLRGPDPERSWRHGITLQRADGLPAGAWHIERGAAVGRPGLVAAADQALTLVRPTAQDDGVEVFHFALPPAAGRLRPGSVVLTRHGIAALAEQPDGALTPWLFHHPERPPLAIVCPAAIDGLEPVVEGDGVSVMALIRGARHRLNPLVPRFEVDPVPGPVTNRIEEALPGGVLYRAHDWATLRLRDPADDQPLPVDEPRAATIRGAVEGRRVWILAADGPRGCTVTAIDRVPC
ncbi:MAG: hypothetical protein H6702_20440 [Myxococcales bacterium]|nr:hypothetical protein [Myxococcales bacterium]